MANWRDHYKVHLAAEPDVELDSEQGIILEALREIAGKRMRQ